MSTEIGCEKRSENLQVTARLSHSSSRMACLVHACAPYRVRLVLARVRAGAMNRGGGKVGDHDAAFGTFADIVDLHLTLSRALLLLGATKEADGHVRTVERLLSTFEEDRKKGEEFGDSVGSGVGAGAGGGKIAGTPHNAAAVAAATAALRLEIELLSRTPVVLETVDDVTSVRESLLIEMERLRKGRDKLWGSIANPLEVGVRAQFLATYQV